jgi:phosphoglycolate phosphatase
LVFADRFDAFIFDLDGTILRIPVDWESARTRLKAVFHYDSEFIPLFGTLQKLLAQRPELRAQAFSAIDQFEIDAVKDAEPVSGSLDLLMRLSTRAALALVTMQGRKACDALVGKFSMQTLFRCCVTREDSLDRSEQIAIAMGRVGGSARRTLFVGDRLNDVVAARKAGVEVVVLGRTVDGQTQPDYNFRTTSEFASFLSS